LTSDGREREGGRNEPNISSSTSSSSWCSFYTGDASMFFNASFIVPISHRLRPGCSMPELWDLHDVENRGKEPLCNKLQAGITGPFKMVYENPHYKIFLVQ
jgi:Q-cell neuroblast polarisation